MAQLVAQLICNQWVAGSIPVGGTIKTPGQTLKTSGLTFSYFLDKNRKIGVMFQKVCSPALFTVYVR